MDYPTIPLEALRQALATLPENRRQVYILTAKEGLGYQAVAQIMELTTREVEQLLAEALADLMRALDA